MVKTGNMIETMNRSAKSSCCGGAPLSFGFIGAVRFFAYCAFYYFTGTRMNDPHGTPCSAAV